MIFERVLIIPTESAVLDHIDDWRAINDVLVLELTISFIYIYMTFTS